MVEYRINAEELLKTLGAWNALLAGRGKIHLIACGGTALTLLGYKASTVDVDFMIPVEKEYQRLVYFLKQAGYEQLSGHRWKRPGEVILFDLFVGNSVYTTTLLDSPLKPGGNRRIKEFKKIYLGVLNPIDLTITKLFRGHEVDFQDCQLLIQNEKIDLKVLEERYQETAKYETGEEKMLKTLKVFLKRIKDKV